jgi:hypothetical protein
MIKLVIKKPFSIITGSHVRNLNGTGSRKLEIGEEVIAEDSYSCTVWLTTKDNVRGNIECGTYENLIKDGRAEVK